jgi:polyisoprenyl-phosphate glycosyltransferase
VHTRRLSRGGESAVKLFSTRVGYHILRMVASVDLPIETGDFKLLSRRAVKHLVRLKEKNPYLRGMVHWIGFNQVSVTYHREARHSGETKFPALGWRVMANFFESAVISFSLKPLYLAGFMGFFAALTGFLVLAHTLLEYIRGHNIPGWTAIMVAVLFLGSFQLLALGVIGLYLGNVMLEVKGRPNYIVKRLFGFQEDAV